MLHALSALAIALASSAGPDPSSASPGAACDGVDMDPSFVRYVSPAIPVSGSAGLWLLIASAKDKAAEITPRAAEQDGFGVGGPLRRNPCLQAILANDRR